MQTIFDIIGMITLTGTIAGAVATFLLKIFGERWIGSKFDKEIERLKNEHTRELAHLTYQISGLLDRTTRLNDFEFKVLPEAWAKLLTAYNGTLVHTSSGRMGTSVNSMDNAALEELLKQSPLFDFQKDRVRQATDKGEVYNELMYHHEKAEIREGARQFSGYLEGSGIFLRDKAKFKELDDIIWKALQQHGLIREHRIMPKPDDNGIQALEKRGRALLEEIEVDIHAHLWSTDLTARPTDPKAVQSH